MARGRKPGSRVAGSLGAFYATAQPGDVVWTEQLDQCASSTAGRAGVHVQTERWLAIHPGTRRVVDLTRVEVLDVSKRRTMIDAQTT